MHVLSVVCNDKWMPENFSEGWRRCGCQVTEFFYSPNIGRINFDHQGNSKVQLMNEDLLNLARSLHREQKLDLIFMSVYDDFLLEETAIALRKLSVPLVNYHPDMIVQWFRMLKIGKYFDFIGCAQKSFLNVFEKKGFKAHYLPFASNPLQEGLMNSASTTFFNGVTFLGAPIGYRPQVLAHLHFNRIPLRIYGHHWDWVTRKSQNTETAPVVTTKLSGLHFRLPKLSAKNKHDLKNYAWERVKEEGTTFLVEQYYKWKESLFPIPITDGDAFYGNIPESNIHGYYNQFDFPLLVRNSAINVGFTHITGNYGSRFEKRQVRLRDFEIPLAGGFYLAQTCPELTALYKTGKHIDTWNTKEELLDKCNYYLQHPAERAAIAKAGYEHALQHHTWEQRFSIILKELNIKSNNQ